MPESFTPREFIDKINAENPGSVFDPYGVEGLVTKQHEDSAGADLLTQAKAEVAKEKAKNTPEGQVAELERQIEALRQWLIKDGKYTLEDVDIIIQEIKVEFNQEAQQAEVLGDLWLNRLTSAEGLTLPNSIRGNLHLSGLTSAEGLTLPSSIDGGLTLDSLPTAEGLILPVKVKDYLTLFRLTSTEREVLRYRRPDLADKIIPKD